MQFFDFKKQMNKFFLAFGHLLKIWLSFDKFWELFGDQIFNTMFEINKIPVYLDQCIILKYQFLG